MADVLSFHVAPGVRGIAQAEQRLRELGFTQLKRSRDGRYLQVVASKSQVVRAFGLALLEREREVQVGPAKRRVTAVEMAEGTTIPDSLRDVIAEIIFAVPPNYHDTVPSLR
jgi:hypothetical protein